MNQESDLSGMPAAAREQVMIAREIATQLAAEAEAENSPQDEAREEGIEATEGENQAAPDEGKIDPNDYKARYAALRNKRDEKIDNLLAKEAAREKELREKAQRIADLEAALSSTPKREGFKLPAALNDEFSDESRAALEESINGYVGQNLSALQQNIQSVGRSIVDGQKAEVNRAAEDIYKARLEKLKDDVTRITKFDYRSIDGDSRFRDYLKNSVDEDSGQPKINLFVSAARSGDVRRIADYVSSFLDNQPQPRSLESKVMPSKSSYGDTLTGKGPNVWTKSMISEFYDKKQKGGYTPEQEAAIKKDIMRAVNAHEVIDG